jgi:hypothetical protein
MVSAETTEAPTSSRRLEAKTQVRSDEEVSIAEAGHEYADHDQCAKERISKNEA